MGFEDINVSTVIMMMLMVITIILLVAIGINVLGSCRFKYAMIAIGSNSMNPVFYRGDAIIFENTNDVDRFNVGDILVFKKDDKMVVHRIIDIKNIEGEKIFYTKGDNNLSKDEGFIDDTNIIGRVRFKIVKIGKPTIWLHEIFES